LLTSDDKKRLTRFADEPTTANILQQKEEMQPFVFDRLYLNKVALTNYNIDGDFIKLHFDLYSTFRRISTGSRLQLLDNDFITSHGTVELSRNKNAMSKADAAETVYSYECSSCGAPYTDTTDDSCNYCGQPVIDKQKNWVLTDFTWG
jgi:DNA-directed RNA polymerase subunit RPC12/RpoP